VSYGKHIRELWNPVDVEISLYKVEVQPSDLILMQLIHQTVSTAQVLIGHMFQNGLEVLLSCNVSRRNVLSSRVKFSAIYLLKRRAGKLHCITKSCVKIREL